MSTKPTLREIGEFLIELPPAGTVTDARLAAQFELTSPNVHNALTYLVPALDDAAKMAGKKSFFGGDKGAKAYDDYRRKLRLIFLGLYADGHVQKGSSAEECLYQLVLSLSMFKAAYPNWPDAYSLAFKEFFVNRDTALILAAMHQSTVELS